MSFMAASRLQNFHLVYRAETSLTELVAHGKVIGGISDGAQIEQWQL